LINNNHICPFYNIKIYLVRDNDYPKLDIYLCYDCGFYYDIILKNQKGLYQEYEKCFIHFKEKGIIMKLKNYAPITSPTENQQRNKTTDEGTEPTFFILYHNYKA
jgi:hypothetical protein